MKTLLLVTVPPSQEGGFLRIEAEVRPLGTAAVPKGQVCVKFEGCSPVILDLDHEGRAAEKIGGFPVGCHVFKAAYMPWSGWEGDTCRGLAVVTPARPSTIARILGATG